MGATIVYDPTGRGAWPAMGWGGTLNIAGNAPGRYYRTAVGSTTKAPGAIGAMAERKSLACNIDEYAVWRTVLAVQRYLGATTIDGVWSADTEARLKVWQTRTSMSPDGIYGPASAKTMWRADAIMAARRTDSTHPDLTTMLLGHIGWESGWDPGAVGASTPQDLGLGQINGPAHPELNANDRLDPQTALPWMADFVDANLVAMAYNTRDAIAAYNLGVGGARSWIKAGRPDNYTRPGAGGNVVTTNVKKYIDNVLAAAAG